jgi:arylsulfatase A-like enzyme
VPNAPFRGRSGIGAYGDFVCEVDWVVGQIMESLDRTGQAENTLLVFTSDNGPERRTPDDEGVYDRARRTAHYSMGPLRGMKRDAWDGGHRVPFVAAWPGVIPAGSTCDQTVGLLDLMATCSDITAVTLPEGAGEDSVSMWPLLQGLTDQATRACLVHHSASGKFAIREGDWVYIEAPSGGDNPEPDWFIVQRGYAPHDQPGELFNLADDLAERTNRHAERPELVAHLAGRLRQIKNGHAPTRSAAIDEPMTE